MRHNAISEEQGRQHRGSHHTAAAAFWIVAGVVAIVAFGDALMVLAIALVIVTTVWWVFREAEHRADGADAVPFKLAG